MAASGHDNRPRHDLRSVECGCFPPHPAIVASLGGWSVSVVAQRRRQRGNFARPKYNRAPGNISCSAVKRESLSIQPIREFLVRRRTIHVFATDRGPGCCPANGVTIAGESPRTTSFIAVLFRRVPNFRSIGSWIGGAGPSNETVGCAERPARCRGVAGLD